MVLRSGIIIPFQFRDTKKLLMIGGAEENRDLCLWDLKNVVRAAFGVYNFEFRNKKIGFNIPEDLLLHYLAQRHDLTNFVLEIYQAYEDTQEREVLSFEPSCSITNLATQKLNESGVVEYTNTTTPNMPNDSSPSTAAQQQRREHIDSPTSVEQTSNSDDHCSNPETAKKLRTVHAGYAEHTPESLTQSIDPMDIIPKSEEAERVERRLFRPLSRQPPPQHIQSQQPTTPHLVAHQLPPQQFFQSAHYTPHGLIAPAAPGTPAHAPSTPGPMLTPQQPSYTPGMMNRFRIFEADQDGNYIAYSHCRCSAQKLECDTPPPPPPPTQDLANLCTITTSRTPVPTILPQTATTTTTPITNEMLSNEEQECLRLIKLRHAQAEQQNSNILNVEERAGGSSTASDIPIHNSFETCSPKIDCDEHEQMLPDSPHSQQHQPQLQQQQPLTEELLQRQQLEHERIKHEYMLQQQQQQQQLQQQQQHLEAIMLQENSTTAASAATVPTTTNVIRQRKERMSKRQKELYVTFLQQYSFINEHRRNDPVLDPYWIKLADLLNAVPQGAVKHMTEWKQTFDNWRYRVFLYARYNSKLKGDEALNPRNFKPLTRTDKHAYSIWIQNPDTAPPDLNKMHNVFMNLDETLQD